MTWIRFSRYLAVLGLAVGSLGLSSSVLATASTHVWGPSTDVQPYKSWHITCDMYAPVQNDANGAHIPTVSNVGLTVGVLPFKKINAEVGFDHKTGLGIADNYPLYANAKLGIPEGAFGANSPALAVGILDIGTKKNVTDYDLTYAKIAKSVKVGAASLGRLSLGYFSGNQHLLLNEQGQKDNTGVMAAWERTMTGISDKLWLCLEYMGSNSGYGTWNVGGSWKFAPNVGVIIGYDMFNSDLLVNTVTMQVDIDF